MKAVPASASWIDNDGACNDEYREGLNQEYIDSHRECAIGVYNLIHRVPQGGDPPSDVDVSSIGIAEGLIHRIKGTMDWEMEIQNVSVGIEILTMQRVRFFGLLETSST